MDRAALGHMPLNGCQSHRSGKMAEDTLLQKTGVALAAEANEDSEHHEYALFSRYSVGMGGQKSNYECSLKRKTAKAPDVLIPEEILAILAELPDPLRIMIELDAFTGLRRGELIGLRWEDVDFEQLVLHVRRSVVAMVEGAPKTEASQKDVPLDAQTAESLFAWRQMCPYSGPGDWVFASPAMKGKQPYRPARNGGTTASLH